MSRSRVFSDHLNFFDDFFNDLYFLDHLDYLLLFNNLGSLSSFTFTVRPAGWGSLARAARFAWFRVGDDYLLLLHWHRLMLRLNYLTSFFELFFEALDLDVKLNSTLFIVDQRLVQLIDLRLLLDRHPVEVLFQFFVSFLKQFVL